MTVIPFHRKDEWLASVDLVRRADGSLALVLTDARTSLVESEPVESGPKLDLIADMILDGLSAMRADAKALTP